MNAPITIAIGAMTIAIVIALCFTPPVRYGISIVTRWSSAIEKWSRSQLGEQLDTIIFGAIALILGVAAVCYVIGEVVIRIFNLT